MVVLQILLIGVGATAFLDAWLVLLRRLGVATMNMALIGRWVGHLALGQWRHQAIGRAAPLHGELALGWLVHYAIGVLFAAALALWQGTDWLNAPRLAPALAFGVLTVASPLLVMQPAMGLGMLASRTPTPLKNCLRSVVNHTVFGFGLFVAAVAVA